MKEDPVKVLKNDEGYGLWIVGLLLLPCTGSLSVPRSCIMKQTSCSSLCRAIKFRDLPSVGLLAVDSRCTTSECDPFLYTAHRM